MRKVLSEEDILLKGVDVINARIDSIMDLSKFMITANLTILGINIALGRDISASGLWIVIPPILYLLIILIALIITIPKTKPIEEMDKNFFSSLILQRSRCYYILLILFAAATLTLIYSLYNIALMGGFS